MAYRKASNPVIKLTSKEWAEFRRDIIEFIKQKYPNWTDFLPDDLGMALVETMAGFADYFAYYQNVTANESFLSTAQFRSSLFKLARLFGYVPRRPSAAYADLTFFKRNPEISAFVPQHTVVSTQDGAVRFVTLQDLIIPAGQESGTVGAVHGEFITDEILGISDGQPYQRFPLTYTPLSRFYDGTNSLRVFVDDEEWAETPSFIRALQSNSWFLDIEPGKTPDQDKAVVCFGDGLLGNIPPRGAVIKASYLIGGGRIGNVGAGTLTVIEGNIENIRSVTNLAPAAGGEDAETDNELRRNAPFYVYTRRRMVTKADYEKLLSTIREISKVHVVHPKENIIEIYILASGGTLPSQSLLEKIQKFVDDHKIIDDDVRILAPRFVPIDVTAEVQLVGGVDVQEALNTIGNDLCKFLDKRDFVSGVYIQDIYEFFAHHELVYLATVKKLARSGESGVSDILVQDGEVITDGVITLTTV